jgi:hypothetical protein
VDGVRLEKLLLLMSESLMDYGSVELKKSIGKYAPIVFKIAATANSLTEILRMIKRDAIQVN